jgi:hypothetical protein
MDQLAGLEYPDGDPGALESAASRLRALARHVAVEARAVKSAAHVQTWKGPAAAVFAGVVGAQAIALHAGPAALDGAARAVEQLADDLRSARQRIKRWAQEIEAAEQALRQQAEQARRQGWPGEGAGAWSIAATTFAWPPGMSASRVSPRRVAGLLASAPSAGACCTAAWKEVRIMPGSSSVVRMPNGPTSGAKAS